MPKPAATDIKQTSQVGRSRRTSLIHDTHEYHTKHTSRSRLLICKGCMGRIVKPLRKIDPIAQNLAQTWLHTKRYTEESMETLPAHTAELQKLREACGGLGVDVSDAQFARVISLSMLTPSWDPNIGTLGGVLDPKVVILHLITEWSRRQGLTTSGKDPNMVFQTGT